MSKGDNRAVIGAWIVMLAMALAVAGWLYTANRGRDVRPLTEQQVRERLERLEERVMHLELQVHRGDDG